MRLQASCQIEFEAPQSTAAIFMLRPRSGAGQWVSSEEYILQPHTPVIEYTDVIGNLCQRVVIPSGETRVTARCTVDVADNVDMDSSADWMRPEHLPDMVLQFLLPSRYCQSDQLGAMAHEIVANVRPGFDQVETIRKWVNKNIEYRYGFSTPQTTACDTAKDRVGVCRDFTHLSLALCRALNIPARMAVGYALRLETPDIHAWFEAYVGGRWYIFDATQEMTDGNRITIAYGRDATDVAFVTQFGPLTLKSLQVNVVPVA